MITLFDRYLIRRFLGFFLGALAVFLSIFLVVDLVENIDKFIDNELGFSTILNFYVNMFPFYIHIAIPMASLLAIVFHLGKLNKLNELTAIKAFGISLY
ncbi:MAG TPA: LptF/LptG family permease, partial [Candidatus Marinimicrobia bacterium]|nr:LptF/LptG family permease [Candidatus Neomarinimicrobiota bacterium]